MYPMVQFSVPVTGLKESMKWRGIALYVAVSITLVLV